MFDVRATRKHKEKLAKSFARMQRHKQQLEYLEAALTHGRDKRTLTSNNLVPTDISHATRLASSPASRNDRSNSRFDK